MWKVREIADKVTNVVMNYTEIESRVREATNDDPWGPTGTIKHELSQATFSYDQFPEVMGMLWKRIAENKRSPRRIYKSMLLLHHLLLHGSDRVVRAAQDRIYEIRSLQDYHVIYEPGFNLDAIIPPSGTETKDGELNVRVKAKDLVELVQDEERLREERKKARKNRDKYVGIGSDKMMTSKWDGNNGDYGGGYDDEYGKKSRSPSPPFGNKKEFKPYRDSESDVKKSSSSNSFNNNHNSSSFFKTKPAPPSPGVEVSDDFDPRAEEKASADFGDFTSATAKSNNIVSASSTPAAATSSDGGDFADFQSAFANLEQQKAASSNKADDLLGLTIDLGTSSAVSNNASLLSQDLFSNNSVIPTASMSASNSMEFASFGQSPPAFAPSMPSPVSMGQFSPTGANSHPQQMMNFGENNLLTPVLEPAKRNETGSANANSTASNNNNVQKQSLMGTTWSDLNLGSISIDDLNLGRSNSRNAAGNKTPMNQLKTNNTSNSLGGFL